MFELIYLLFAAILLFVTWLTGRTAERRHYRRLEAGERALSGMLVNDLKTFPGREPELPGATLVLGQVVIATDYFKRFMAGFRYFFGGEVRSYQSVMIRARREALLRMMRSAWEQGYDAVGNIRYESADIGGEASGRGVAMVEVLAYGTAYRTGRLDSPGGAVQSPASINAE